MALTELRLKQSQLGLRLLVSGLAAFALFLLGSFVFGTVGQMARSQKQPPATSPFPQLPKSVDTRFY